MVVLKRILPYFGKILAPLQSLRRLIHLLWQSSPLWTVTNVVLMLVEVGFNLIALYLIKQLIDTITESLGGNTADLTPALIYVALAGGATLIHLVAKSLASLASSIQGQFVADYVDEIVHSKAIEVDLAFYESPSYFDSLERAKQAGMMRPAGVSSNLLHLVTNSITLTAIGGVLLSIHWLLVPVLLIGVIPGLWVRLYFTRVMYEWQHRRTQMYRRAAYMSGLITTNFYAKEVRINCLGDYLRGVHRAIKSLIRQENIRIGKRRTAMEILITTVSTLVLFVSMAYLAWQASLGRLSVGDLVLFLLVFQRGQGTLKSLMGNISKVYEDHLYIGQLFDFLDVKPTLTQLASPLGVPRPMMKGVVMENVTFQYPNSSREALSNVSLAIPPGKVIALVGANGSGKTTLIKILCRLYDPTKGRVVLDDLDVRQFDINDYRRVFSIVFQDYVKYSLTVRDNIRFGDINLPEDAQEIRQAAVLSGADGFVGQLRYGYDTQLSRLFDAGEELSIGQWQKIALARAFLHQSQVVVLDEPTSALDANAEFELFQNFRDRIAHRAAIVISHRLSTVRQADYIYVLDQGRIAEEGTHNQLMGHNGIYKRMFERQGFYYRNSVPLAAKPWDSQP